MRKYLVPYKLSCLVEVSAANESDAIDLVSGIITDDSNPLTDWDLVKGVKGFNPEKKKDFNINMNTIEVEKNNVFEVEPDHVTKEMLIHILENVPDGTKILIEDSDGGSSSYLTFNGVSDAWFRECSVEGTSENVMMFTSYKEDNMEVEK